MTRNKKGLNHRTQWILSRTLEYLVARPPNVVTPNRYGIHDYPVYHKHVNDTVTKKMHQLKYKVEAVFSWDEEYEKFLSQIEGLPWPEVSQRSYVSSLRTAQELLEKMKTDIEKSTVRSDEEWEDIDSSMASIGSSFSSDRSVRLTTAKKILQNKMQESARKRTMRLSKMDDKSLKTPLKKVETEQSSERASRALKRQASVVLASEAKKDKKNSGHGVAKTEFARSQNSRVQIVKERKELQDKEKKEMLEAKLQKKEMQFKEKKISSNNAATSLVKNSSSFKAPVKQSSTNKLTAKQVPTNGSKQNNETATKPQDNAPVIKASSLYTGSPFNGKMISPVMSLQNKAKTGLRQGDLAKQAIYQSILAAGDDARMNINSTFLPGAETIPNFDASLALRTNECGETFVVHADNGFKSKPGLVSSPAHQSKNASGFIDSFNESFRDYGLGDLCSDSDNTDDENAPSKPVPKWAELKSKRFKSYIKKQEALGNDIEKYRCTNIYMPVVVDLEIIFEEKNKRFDRLDTSSGMWNDTQDFIH